MRLESDFPGNVVAVQHFLIRTPSASKKPDFRHRTALLLKELKL
jgi:hypothetical protein